MSLMDASLRLSFHEGPFVLPPDDFKAAFRNHAAGVVIITAEADEGPIAMTISSLFSISADPPLFVFSASDLSSSTPTLRKVDTIVAHLLDADHLELALRCGTKGASKFDGDVPWDRLPTGEPYFPDVAIRLRGRIVARVAAGSSTLIVAEAIEAQFHAPDPAVPPPKPLVYHNRTWHTLGQESLLRAAP